MNGTRLLQDLDESGNAGSRNVEDVCQIALGDPIADSQDANQHDLTWMHDTLAHELDHQGAARVGRGLKSKERLCDGRIQAFCLQPRER